MSTLTASPADEPRRPLQDDRPLIVAYDEDGNVQGRRTSWGIELDIFEPQSLDGELQQLTNNEEGRDVHANEHAAALTEPREEETIMPTIIADINDKFTSQNLTDAQCHWIAFAIEMLGGRQIATEFLDARGMETLNELVTQLLTFEARLLDEYKKLEPSADEVEARLKAEAEQGEAQ